MSQKYDVKCVVWNKEWTTVFFQAEIYKIEKTYKNGVRIGGVEGHKTEVKRIGHSEQAWFPKNWNDDEVLKAGTYVANNSKDTGMPKFAEYNGVRVGIFIDGDGYPSTIFPDGSRQPKRSDDWLW